jgi:hypothetical protein
MKCSNNLKQIGLAVHNYELTNGHVPPAWTPDLAYPSSGTGSNYGVITVAGGQSSIPNYGTIHFLILPYIEQDNLYQASRTGNQFNASTSGVPNTILQMYLCASDSTMNSNITRSTYASTSYAANLMVFNPRGPGTVPQAMPNGTSNTVMFAERYKDCTPSWGGVTHPAWAMHPAFSGHLWDTPVYGIHDFAAYIPMSPPQGIAYHDPSFDAGRGYPFQVAPAPNACDWYVTQGSHTGVMNALLGDGSVRGVRGSMSVPTWVQANNPKLRQPLGSDW